MFDSHAHYDHKRFECDRDELLNKMHREGHLNYCINACIGFETNAGMLEVLDKYDWIYCAVGLHPDCVPESNESDAYYEAELRRLAKHPKVVAIGETGLDYHRFKESDSEEYIEKIKERQRVWFRKLVGLSIELKLPLILHIREAYEDGLEVLDEFPEAKRGVIHCFASDTATAKEYINRGFVLGIGGKVTHEEETGLRACVRELPLEHMLLETDAPYVMPTGAEGKRNTSENLELIVKEIARFKEISEAKVEKVTEENAKILFLKEKIMNKQHFADFYEAYTYIATPG